MCRNGKVKELHSGFQGGERAASQHLTNTILSRKVSEVMRTKKLSREDAAAKVFPHLGLGTSTNGRQHARAH